MSLKSSLSKLFAATVVSNIKKWSVKPVETQQKEFQKIISKAKNTQFGYDHQFNQIKSIADYQQRVPIRDYEGLKPYIDLVLKGYENVLWPGLPLYLAKTSGTTSGTKYIPISKDSISNHIHSARNALLSYISETGNADFVNGKMIFLQGSPEMAKKSGIAIGRLSGIVAHHVPRYLQKNRLPSWETNCINDWETKVDAIVRETANQNMTLISGIPAWVQMYFEKLIANTGKANIAEVFPNFNLFVYGGVNFGPYRANFEKLLGKKVPTIETYPASEGFIAYQNSQNDSALLMVLNKGIFYEFVPVEEYFNEKPTRLTVAEVEEGKNYALIMTTNAGLYAYSIGDTVKVVSKNPFKIIVSGRIKHYTSAFGEHVIAEEVESALSETLALFNLRVKEFHVAPQVAPKDGLPYHEWFIDFDGNPANLDAFANKLDDLMQAKNIYYRDLITGKVLSKLKITLVKPDGFNTFMKARGKLGGQNKIPRLANDRQVAQELENAQVLV